MHSRMAAGTGVIRVGYGAYVASKLLQDVAKPLRGKDQTVQKGELAAAAHALRSKAGGRGKVQVSLDVDPVSML